MLQLTAHFNYESLNTDSFFIGLNEQEHPVIAKPVTYFVINLVIYQSTPCITRVHVISLLGLFICLQLHI